MPTMNGESEENDMTVDNGPSHSILAEHAMVGSPESGTGVSDGQGKTSKMRIAYILHRFPCLTETFIMREMYWLRQHDVALHIYSLLPPRREPVHAQASALKCCAYYSPLLSWTVLRANAGYLQRSPLRYLIALARLLWQTYREPAMLARALTVFPVSVYFARLAEEQAIEHIHAHFVWLEGLAAGVVRDLTGISFSIQPHAHGLFMRNQRDVRCELENATRVIGISTYHRAYIASLCPRIDVSDIDIVYCGIEPDHMHPVCREPHDGPMHIVSVGRLIEKKGYEDLIEACAMLMGRGVDFRCTIVGTGPDERRLRQRIRDCGLDHRIQLLGALSQGEICDVYRQSDVFALPCVVARNGDRDGIPVALMEAMAFALPVVTTAVTGIPDLVRDQVNGLLVPQRKPEALADALKYLCANPDVRERLGSEGRATVVERFDVRVNAGQTAALFRRSVARRVPG